MTIEQKALELVNTVRWERDLPAHDISYIQRANAPDDEALCRALEAHEADKSRHAAELREQAERFSEAARIADQQLALEGYGPEALARDLLSPFILAPVDPLAEVMRGTGCEFIQADTAGAELLKQSADRLGYTFAIVKKEAVNG